MSDNQQGNMHEVETVSAALRERLQRALYEAGDYPLQTPQVTLHRRHETNVPENCFYKPIVGFTLQGAKRTVVGQQEYRYGANNCIVTGVAMPSINYITDASPEKPYLVISLYLDMQLISQLAAHITVKQRPVSGNSIISPSDPEVLKALLRLVELEEKPEQIPVLSPMILREIHFRLLAGPQGGLLRTISTLGSQSHRIAQAISWIRNNFKAPLTVDAIADTVHMSLSSFRRHFKMVTSMTPTEYHKRLRLYEAQRLMLEEHSDATRACYAVGYESPHQFQREYKRLFGDAPLRSVSQLR